ncbi:MAG TPA: L,D-transpeptidase family protein [Vicinamibacterales bacterium]|nr:L,D-transpeptidase family protein [Vicinamibacterales bacterium]
MDVALRGALEGPVPEYVTKDVEGKKLWPQTRTFYERRQFAPAWLEKAKPRPQVDALVKSLREADREGLDPNLYNVSMIEERRAEATKGFLSDKGIDPREAGALDVWLTYLYMKHASDLADGLSDLAQSDPAWKIRPETFDPLAHLEKALSDNHVSESLRELTPTAPEYDRLRTALANHRDIQAKGGWPRVPDTLKLKPGQKSQDLSTLAKRLAVTGDYKGAIPADNQALAYSTELQEAVKVFQRRHGLTDDAGVGKEAVAEMNVPVEERISEIQMNMERWRWLPRELGERYILVNIPEMRLDVYEGDRVPLTMRVVVGKPDSQTPIFNDEMTHIVFSPYWNVPPSIAKGETLPSMMKDPNFLARNNMEVVDSAGTPVDASSIDLSNTGGYRFRQRPGNDNSLGLVKFMFPNQFNVYLHDTPADALFGRSARSLSHGCVRLEQPQALAEYVLRDQPEWTSERITAAMNAGTEKHVKLKAPLPVYLGYWTARARPDGTLQFRKDVYNIDGRQMAKLEDRLNRLRQSSAAAVAATTAPEKPSASNATDKSNTREAKKKGTK